jgi:hypothetical protein
VDQNILNVSSTRFRGLEADPLSRSDSPVAIADDVSNAAGGLAAERDDPATTSRDIVTNDDVLRRSRDAQSVEVATCLEADVVVVVVDVAVLNQDIARRVDTEVFA